MTMSETQRRAVPERTASILHYLESARSAVESARLLLDTSSSPCGACGKQRYTRWPEVQAERQLSAMTEKLGKLAAVLGGAS